MLALEINDERLWEALAALYSWAAYTSVVVADQEPGAPLDDQLHERNSEG
jgi:hypothetical protein